MIINNRSQFPLVYTGVFSGNWSSLKSVLYSDDNITNGTEKCRGIITTTRCWVLIHGFSLLIHAYRLKLVSDGRQGHAR